MERIIKFEELPESAQNDWAEYVNRYKKEKIEILKIRFDAGMNGAQMYKLYYEFFNVLGVATKTIMPDGYTFDTRFELLSVSDVRELYHLSSLIKEYKL